MKPNPQPVNTLRLLLDLAAGCRLRMVCALLVTVIAALAELLPFVVLFRAAQYLLTESQSFTTALPTLAIWLLAAIVLKYVAYGVAYSISHHAAYAIMANTRQRLVAQLARAPLPWVHAQGTGALKQSVLDDVERMEAFLAHHLVEVAAAGLTPVFAAVVLLWVDWRLALAVMAVGPVAWVTAKLALRGADTHHDTFNASSAAVNNVTVEFLRNMPVLKLFCRSAAHFSLLQQRLDAHCQLAQAITRKTVPGWALFTSVLGAHLLFLLPLGAWLYAHDDINAAQVVAAVLLGAGIFRPLLKVSRFFMDIPPILAGLRRMVPLLAWPPAPEPRHDVEQTIAPQVVFDQVSFHHRERRVLDDVSFDLAPGTFTVLLGPSGSGKSTIAQLVAGLLSPGSGAVTVGGLTTSGLPDAQRARLVALATQEVFLFSGSIRDNLMLARPDASVQDVERAVRTAQAQALIESLPAGEDTEVNELGARLSGGERQRLAVARALLADTPILILDEATAFADSLTQRAFLAALRREYANKTVLVIAHRLYGIEQADQILILEQGRLHLRGTHDQLMQHSEYRALWQMAELAQDWSLPARESAHD